MNKEEVGNPYVGPRPFQSSERDRFFGRDREARALISLVVSERLVLFYAQSGAGKSSLINARLVPGLEERGFAVLPVGRVSGQSQEGGEARNVFTYNLLLSLEPGDRVRTELAHLDLKGYLAALPVEENPVDTVPVAALDSGYQPLVLIIDQFEELFTTQPEAWAQRGPFIEQLSEAMQADPNLWVVLSMREDYIAALDPYAQMLPNHLRARYYMERMGYPSALEAVTRPVEKIRLFELEAADKLVNNLRLISAGESEDGQPLFVAGEYIEPVQLQVVCYQLWEQLKSRPGENITTADLAHLARGGDLVQFVSNALADFYEQAIARVVRHPGARTTERELRDWFSNELITEANTRGFVFQGDEKTGSLPNSAVRLLESQFIVRSETRAAGKWVELVHDRFVRPIQQANRAWLAAHTSPIAVDAAAWLRAGRDPVLLYDGRQLIIALEEMASNGQEFGEKERAFLQAAQQAAEKKRSARQRRFTALISGLVVLFALMAAFGLYSAVTARRNEQLAIVNSTLAANALQTAQASNVQALVQQSYALDARNEAVIQSTLASDAQARAEYEGKISRSGQAAALSAYYLETRLDVARILAVEAYRAFDGWEARKALLEGLQRGASVRVAREYGPLTNGLDIWGVAISPDGGLVAAGDALGGVTLWDTQTGKQAADQPPQAFRQTQLVYSVAFDATGNLLASAGKDGIVGLWDRSTGQVSEIPVVFNDWATNLAFQPGGSLLAVSRRDGMISLIDYRQAAGRGVLPVSSLGAWCLAWSPDGQRLAVGYSDGSIRVWDIVNQLNPPVLKGHDSTVRGLAWSPDGRYLYSGARDSRLILWDVSTGQWVRQSLPEESREIMALALSQDGQLLVTGNADLISPITVWNVDTLRPAGTLGGHSEWVLSVAFSPVGDRFASGGVDESVFTWQVETQQPLSRVIRDATAGQLVALGLDASGRWVAVSGGDSLGLLSEASGALPARLAGGDVVTTVLQRKSLAVAVGAGDGSLALRDVLTGQAQPPELPPLGGTILALAGSPGGDRVAAAYCREASPEGECTGSGLRVIDLASGSPSGEDLSQPGKITGLAFHPDDSLLAIGMQDGTIGLRSLEGKDPEAFPLLQGTNSPVTALVFSADGSLLAAGQASGNIGLWDTNGYRLIGTLVNSDHSPVTGLVFRAAAAGDRLNLLSASESGFIREWDVDFQSWSGRACELAGRSLTQAEWSQLFPAGIEYNETCGK